MTGYFSPSIMEYIKYDFANLQEEAKTGKDFFLIYITALF